MSAEPNQPAQLTYEQHFQVLADAHHDDGDPSVFVFDNYLKWKGVPLNATRLTQQQEHLSRHFAVLEFSGSAEFQVFATLGASYKVIPGSQDSFGDRRGVRYEYLLHAPAHYSDEISSLMLLVADYPFSAQVEYQPGYVLPIGEPIVGGVGMEFLYFTYPYLDDQRMLAGSPWGQIERGKYLIQTLWIMPIYRSEVSFLRRNGPDAFEEHVNRRHAQRYDAYDFTRLPYV
jgi:hypothetical protein